MVHNFIVRKELPIQEEDATGTPHYHILHDFILLFAVPYNPMAWLTRARKEERASHIRNKCPNGQKWSIYIYIFLQKHNVVFDIESEKTPLDQVTSALLKKTCTIQKPAGLDLTVTSLGEDDWHANRAVFAANNGKGVYLQT